MYLTNFLHNIQKMPLPLFLPDLGSDFLESGYGAPSFPALQIYANTEHVLVRAEIPGLTRDEISLSITDDVLTISGELKSAMADVKIIRRERAAGMFQKTVELPSPVDADKAEAVLKNGILEITLPIRESVKPREIPVTGE